jgi:hypothetical protein
MMNMRRTLTTLAAAAIIATGGGIAADAHTGESPHRHAVIPTTPCEYEDSVNCFWDAGSMGNGSGHSFWVIEKASGEVCIRYLSARYNRKHGECWFD